MNESYTTLFKPGQSASDVPHQSLVDNRQPLQFTYLYTARIANATLASLVSFAPWSKFPARSMEIAMIIDETAPGGLRTLNIPELGGRVLAVQSNTGETKAVHRFYQDKYITGGPISAQLLDATGAPLTTASQTDVAIRITFYSE